MRWLVEVGEVVAVDQPVVEVETAKAMVEVPCPYGGVVTARFGEEGTELPVGAPLLTVAVGRDGRPGAPTASGGPPVTAPDARAPGNVLVGYGTGRAGRAAPRRTDGYGRAPGWRPGRSRLPAPASATAGARHRQAPAVRRRLPVRARSQGPSPSSRRWCGGWPGSTASICGSWRVRARRADPARRRRAGAARRRRTTRAAGPDCRCLPRTGRPRAAGATARASRCTGIRGAVADKLSRSRREIPDATCWVDADATELMARARAR